MFTEFTEITGITGRSDQKEVQYCNKQYPETQKWKESNMFFIIV